MAGREESRGEGKLHQSAVGDRNALDISSALMFGISKLQHFLLLIQGSWRFYYFDAVSFFLFLSAKERG